MDIMSGETCRQFRLLTLYLFKGQFVNPAGKEVTGIRGGCGCRYFSPLRLSLYENIIVIIYRLKLYVNAMQLGPTEILIV